MAAILLIAILSEDLNSLVGSHFKFENYVCLPPQKNFISKCHRDKSYVCHFKKVVFHFSLNEFTSGSEATCIIKAFDGYEPED